MASGASRLRATKIVAGAIRAAAVRPSPRRFSTTGPWASAVSVIRLGSALERLVPPVLERRVVLGHVAVVEIDQPLLLFVGEALLCRGCHHGVEIGVGAFLVGGVLGHHEA